VIAPFTAAKSELVAIVVDVVEISSAIGSTTDVTTGVFVFVEETVVGLGVVFTGVVGAEAIETETPPCVPLI